jgi:hypothetical protein
MIMAERTVRCEFLNLTNQSLVRESGEREKLAHGKYTDPWFPPQNIAPGAVGKWRTESNGFMTGTEGRARYRIGSDTVNLWWNHPFIGGKDCSITIVQDFSGADSTVFEGAHNIDAYGLPMVEDMRDGEVQAWVGFFLFPPLIFVNGNTSGDATAKFAIRRKAQVSSPLFGPRGSGPRSWRINTSQKPEQWEGLWTGNDISVTVAHLGGENMSANITDTTAQPTLQLQEMFSLGHSGWAFNAFALAVQRDLGFAVQRGIGTGEREMASTLIRAAVNTVQAQLPTEQDRVAMVFRNAIQADASKHRLEIPEQIVERLANAVASVAKIRRSTVMLSQGVCLTLYDDFEAGQKVGGHMLYERILLGSGTVLASERLSFYPMLH